ncbi:MAG TPA: peptidoglycan DD-metalloendopeptidase family protein [Paracoccaceae bacterium]|nr:peptidoglycan DD-metalloendopeptidase family protein [Paracoccaceae bacterium]
MTGAGPVASAVAVAYGSGLRDLYAALGAAVAAVAPGTAEAAGALSRAPVAACPGEAGDRLRSVDAGLLAAVARTACGFEAVPGAAGLPALIAAQPLAPMFDPDPAAAPTLALPTGGQRPDMPAFSDRAFDGWFAATGATYGLGLYGEDRNVYRSAQFADAASPERRTIHLGVDIFAPAGTPVRAPLPGRVARVAYNADPLDYGHTLILEHRAGDLRFWLLVGHLGASLPDLCREGDRVEPGQTVAHLGDWHENGGWSPHAHVQIIADRLEQDANFFGVGHASLWPVWRQISPDANLILRLPPGRFTTP